MWLWLWLSLLVLICALVGAVIWVCKKIDEMEGLTADEVTDLEIKVIRRNDEIHHAEK